MKFRALLMMLFMGIIHNAHSHTLSTAFVNADMNESGWIQGEIRFRFVDLKPHIDMDTNRNGELTWAEVLNQSSAIKQYFQSLLILKTAQQACLVNVEETFKVDTHYNDNYLVLPFNADCTSAGQVSVTYPNIDRQPFHHKLIFNLQYNSISHQRIISQSVSSIHLDLQSPHHLDTFIEYLWQGMWHIWIGYDHILFLICFLLAAVFHQNVKTFSRQSLANILMLVTAFTVAHSITLILTAFNWIQLPSHWVEATIALSIFFSAINNIIVMVKRLFFLIFIFGLIHGMGFAGVLGELNIPQGQRVLSTIAFNLGVEIGQILILFIILPMLLMIRSLKIPPKWCLTTGSLGIGGMSLVWLVERL